MSPLIELIQRLKKASKRDQRWLLKQLHPLAPRLSTYLNDESTIPQIKPSLPEWTANLTQEPPLLIACILSQGNYPWQDEFLNTCSNKEAIELCLNNPIPTKSCELLSQLWFKQQAPKFEQLLDELAQTELALSTQEQCHGQDN